MLRAEWRGNVRELRQVLGCARTLATGESIEGANLATAIRMLALCSDESVHVPPSAAAMRERVAASPRIDRTKVCRRMRRLAIRAHWCVTEWAS